MHASYIVNTSVYEFQDSSSCSALKLSEFAGELDAVDQFLGLLASGVSMRNFQELKAPLFPFVSVMLPTSYICTIANLPEGCL